MRSTWKEEEVEEELVAADLQPLALPGEGQPATQLEHELHDVGEQGLFQVALLGDLRSGQEGEVVGVAEHLLGQL